MKSLFIIILCLVGQRAFNQTNDVVMQEKSSNWIKVTSDISEPTAKPKTTTTVKRKTTSRKPAVPKQNTQEQFEKTNSQVNRFKKGKKD